MVLLIFCLQVASNPEIDLGDDDDPDQVEVMLRLMYNDEDVIDLGVNCGQNLTKTLLDYYVLGDKHDDLVLRQRAKELFVGEVDAFVHMRSQSDRFINSAEGIAMVLGPSSTTFGDRSIQQDTLEWCAKNFDSLLWHRPFRKLLSKGQMFSTEFAGRLLLIKARHDRVRFGKDVNKDDVYDDSSADEDSIQAEVESESEVGEDEDNEEDNGDDGNDNGSNDDNEM
jgi:hypothetical protein